MISLAWVARIQPMQLSNHALEFIRLTLVASAKVAPSKTQTLVRFISSQ